MRPRLRATVPTTLETPCAHHGCRRFWVPASWWLVATRKRTRLRPRRRPTRPLQRATVATATAGLPDPLDAGRGRLHRGRRLRRRRRRRASRRTRSLRRYRQRLRWPGRRRRRLVGHCDPGAPWYADADGDGFGDGDDSMVACSAGSGFVEDSTDCDDTGRCRQPGRRRGLRLRQGRRLRRAVGLRGRRLWLRL